MPRHFEHGRNIEIFFVMLAPRHSNVDYRKYTARLRERVDARKKCEACEMLDD